MNSFCQWPFLSPLFPDLFRDFLLHSFKTIPKTRQLYPLYSWDTTESQPNFR